MATQPFDSEDSPISYLPLNENQDEIRLITISPPMSTPSATSFVECVLETVSLKAYTTEFQTYLPTSQPQNNKGQSSSTYHQVPINQSYRFTWGDYAALSYVWGDTNLTQKIIINGKEARVGRNLEIALRALSERAEFTNEYKLWVDAICINQIDLEERSRQIGRMQNIYSDAREVIAWVGEEENCSTQAIHLVQALSKYSIKEDGREGDLLTKLYEQPGYLGDTSWIALNLFMNRPYWCRLWIIQEIVLGSSALNLRCGNASIDWPSFCRGIGFLQDHLWLIKDDLLEYEVIQNGLRDNIEPIWGTRSLHLVHKNLWALSYQKDMRREHLNLTQLLDVANAAEAHDPRDKVYGLVGIMDPMIARHLVPNYRLDASKVFADTAKTFILTYGNLEPIREGNPWSQTKTPSWAADWTWTGRLRYARPETRLWGKFWIEKGRPTLAQASAPYRASGTEPLIASFSHDDMHLVCRGFLIDEVDGLSAREHGYFKWAVGSIVQPDRQRNAYKDAGGVAKALYTALVLDRVAGGEKATSRHAAILNLPQKWEDAQDQFNGLKWGWIATIQGYWFRWEYWRGANKCFKLMGKILDDYFTDIIPMDASEYDYSEAYSCFDRTCKGRRFMTTCEGYLGWAPDNIFGDDESQTKKGDLIAIIFGCSTPLVIRPCGEFFQVVGEAYVQGLMDGESMEGLRSGKFEARDFTFC